MVDDRSLKSAQFNREYQSSPKVNDQKLDRREGKNNAATGISAASVRTLGSQAVAFYFRAPAKAFFRTRVE